MGEHLCYCPLCNAVVATGKKMRDHMYVHQRLQDREQNERDAARYRFLRANKALMRTPKVSSQHNWRFTTGWPPLIGATLDEAVDGAMDVVRDEIERLKHLDEFTDDQLRQGDER